MYFWLPLLRVGTRKLKPFPPMMLSATSTTILSISSITPPATISFT